MPSSKVDNFIEKALHWFWLGGGVDTRLHPVLLRLPPIRSAYLVLIWNNLNQVMMKGRKDFLQWFRTSWAVYRTSSTFATFPTCHIGKVCEKWDGIISHSERRTPDRDKRSDPRKWWLHLQKHSKKKQLIFFFFFFFANLWESQRFNASITRNPIRCTIYIIITKNRRLCNNSVSLSTDSSSEIFRYQVIVKRQSAKKRNRVHLAFRERFHAHENFSHFRVTIRTPAYHQDQDRYSDRSETTWYAWKISRHHISIGKSF
jgi:hypothetical protein